MTRRDFCAVTAATAAAAAAPSPKAATVLFGDQSTQLNRVRIEGDELWVQPADLPRINGFELKKQGACRADVCIPVPKTLTRNGLFHLTGFAKRAGETFVADSGVWSMGEIPVMRGSFLNSRLAPDFAAPDRKGRTVHLSDFKGKKVLVVTWASW